MTVKSIRHAHDSSAFLDTTTSAVKISERYLNMFDVYCWVVWQAGYIGQCKQLPVQNPLEAYFFSERMFQFRMQYLIRLSITIRGAIMKWDIFERETYPNTIAQRTIFEHHCFLYFKWAGFTSLKRVLRSKRRMFRLKHGNNAIKRTFIPRPRIY